MKSDRTKSAPPLPELRKSLEGLPRFSFTTTPSTTVDQSERSDVLFGVESLEQVIKEASQRFDFSPPAKRPPPGRSK